MPAYLYQCVNCLHQDTRIGGVDDHAAMCDRCGYPMVRLDSDIFAPYFDYLESRIQVSSCKGP